MNPQIQLDLFLVSFSLFYFCTYFNFIYLFFAYQSQFVLPPILLVPPSSTHPTQLWLLREGKTSHWGSTKYATSPPLRHDQATPHVWDEIMKKLINY